MQCPIGAVELGRCLVQSAPSMVLPRSSAADCWGVMRSGAACDWYIDLSATALSRQVPRVKGGNRIPRQLHSGDRFAAFKDTLHKILELLGIPVMPILVRSGVAPSLFRPDFLGNIDILKQIFPGVEGFERVDRAQIAVATMIVANHFQPVVNAAENEFC